jgi:2-succinyl-6-hydroxy-2,4-cyclohexadiene-1-carboxylate synthase
MSGARQREIRAGGVRLQVTLRGAGPDLLLLHGFTGSSESMREVAEMLAERFHCIAIDLIGHGASDAPHDPAAYRMEVCTGQLVGVLDALRSRRTHLLGYSMGGRIALALALAQPDRIASALLLGASAGIGDAEAREARRHHDAALAQRIERDGVPAFVDAWLAEPLFESQRRRLSPAAQDAGRAQRLACRAHGLAHALRGMGSGAQPPLHAQLARLDLPVCLAVGSEDAKFHGIALDLAARLPRARVVQIPEAGHAAHLENPVSFHRTALDFFEWVDAGAGAAARPTEPNPQTREVTT